MDRTTLAIKTRKHSERHLPQKTLELKADGEFEHAIQAAARQAQTENRLLRRHVRRNNVQHQASCPLVDGDYTFAYG